MAQVIWSPSARKDLHAIHELIASDSRVYAKRFVEKLFERIQFLSEHPMIGHVVKEFSNKEIREISFSNYRIIHRVRPDQIQILRIFHSKRILGPKLLK